MNGAQVPQHQAGEQRAARSRKADRKAARHVGERPDQAADHDAGRDDGEIGGLDRPVGMAEFGNGSVHVTGAAGNREDVATEYFRLRQDRDLDHAARDLAQVDAARCRQVCDFTQCLAIHRLAAHEDVDQRDRHVEQALVFDLRNDRLDFLHQRVARPGDRHDITGLEHAVGIRIDESVTATDALDEDAQARKQLTHRLAGETARRVNAIGTDFDVTVGREDARVLPDLAAAHLLLVLGARGRKVDADQLRADLRQHDCGPDGAEDVCHGVADRYRVEVSLGLIDRESEAIDLVRRHADRSRDGLRPGVQADCVPKIEACELRAHDRNQQAQRQHDHREKDLLRTLLTEPAEELRPHAVTDGEQEQQEERGLDRARHRYAELSDRNRCEQRRSDVTQAEARQLLGSDEESDRERQEYGQFRVRAECFDDPLPDSHTLPLDAVAPAHVINATITVPQMASITLPTA